MVDERILEIARKITAKRAKTVVDHIIKYGFITTEELTDLYGYSHAPRAGRDVREAGIPLETYYVRDKTGRKIGAYRFADASQIVEHKLGGRQTFSKPFKQLLLNRDGNKCGLCSCNYEDRYLTIDHCVPYEVAGDKISDERVPEDFMLLCGTCQRKKSWSCEHCKNWRIEKDLTTCRTCYWASPTAYTHAAGVREARLEIVWTDAEINKLEKIKNEASRSGQTVQELIKNLLK